MKDFFAWLFSQNNSDLQIGLFDIWHFLYLFIVLGGTAFLGFYMQNKSEKSKDTVVRLMAYLTVGLYVADFFIMPLSDSYDGISAYKLPFNICTVMAVLVPFAQFNKHWKRLKKTIVVLSIASPLMWMCYPGTALGGQPPFSYIIIQTFMYHGFLFAWGVLNLAYGRVKLDFKKIWQELCAILGESLAGEKENVRRDCAQIALGSGAYKDLIFLKIQASSAVELHVGSDTVVENAEIVCDNPKIFLSVEMFDDSAHG